jgi:hypothetical protein
MAEETSAALQYFGAFVSVAGAFATWAGVFFTYKATIKAPVIARDLDDKSKNYHLKFDCLRRFMAYKNSKYPPEWFAAFNEIPVTFNKSDNVVEIFKRVSRAHTAGILQDSDLKDLSKAMFRDLRLSLEYIDDDILLKFFEATK